MHPVSNCHLAFRSPAWVVRVRASAHGVGAGWVRPVVLIAPRLTVADTARVLRDVFAPVVARGAIRRRPALVSLAERRDHDRRAIDTLRRVRERAGDGPALLRMPHPRRDIAVLLSASDVAIALDGTPCPFSTVTPEKQAALRHFQPRGALISDEPERCPRRALNDHALEDAARRAAVAPTVQAAADEFGARIVRALEGSGTGSSGPASETPSGRLTWVDFASAWSAYVAHVVFGPDAETATLERRLVSLRRAANWAYLHPQRRRTRARLYADIARLRDAAPPWSLAGPLRDIEAGDVSAPDDQIAHWLFAFDAGAMATWRAVGALLASPHRWPAARTAGTTELAAAVLESLRLWPTTPMIMREQTGTVHWSSGVATEAATTCVIFAPYFHRADEVDDADAFVPERWSGRDAVLDESLALVPFSGGPAVCPGRHVALDMAATAIRSVLGAVPDDVVVDGPEQLRSTVAPSVLDPFTLALRIGSDRDAPAEASVGADDSGSSADANATRRSAGERTPVHSG